MLVTDVEITQYRYSRETARHMANVCLVLKDRMITLFCELDLPENENLNIRSSAFVGDAIRRLGRMPEFRSGGKTFELAKGLIGTPVVYA